MNTCGYGPQCWVSCILICLGWLLASSGLLYFTWNKVIAEVTKMKQVKYWQALLFLATVCALCAPRAYMKKGHCFGKKGECHYERSGKNSD